MSRPLDFECMHVKACRRIQAGETASLSHSRERRAALPDAPVRFAQIRTLHFSRLYDILPRSKFSWDRDTSFLSLPRPRSHFLELARQVDAIRLEESNAY